MEPGVIKDIIQWNVKSWSVAVDYWEKEIEWNQVTDCLELGGREGGLSLWLALKGKNVICSDLSEVRSTAEGLHKKYNIGSIRYEDIDATSIPYENKFDLIVFKSIMGGIGRNNNTVLQQKAFEQIRKALKPGGKLLFAENLVASPMHKFLRKKFVKWGSSWRYLTLHELELHMQNYSSFKIKTTGFLGAFGRTEQQREFLSGLDQLLFNQVIPDNWKYIAYGIATK